MDPITLADFNVTAPCDQRRARSRLAFKALADHLERFDTATAALSDWCRTFGIGDGHIAADVRSMTTNGKLAHRDVRLLCQQRLVSEARLIYRPDRLPQSTQAILHNTTIPFGAAIAALAPHRKITHLAIDPQSKDGRPALVVHATVFSGFGIPLARAFERYPESLVRPHADQQS